MIKPIKTNYPDLLTLEVSGWIQKHEVKELCETLKRAHAETHHLNLYVLLSNFDGVKADAFNEADEWKNFAQFHRVAIVGDSDWAKQVARLFSFIDRKTINCFEPSKGQAAWDWIVEAYKVI